MSKSKVFAVLGMHRSGTSMITGSLEQAGVFMGQVNQFSENNKKGSKESSFLMQLHEEVLTDNNSSWYSPPYKTYWSPYRMKILQYYIQSFDQHPIWGFKDPRTLLHLKTWNKMIPNLIKVGIFRNPNDVALSLKRRNKFPLQQGLDLWVRYNRELLKEYNRAPFPIIEFKSNKMEMLNNIRRLFLKLNLASDVNKTFYENNLITSESNIPIKAEAARLYNKLKNKVITDA